MTDAVGIECTTSQFCSVPCVSYTVGSAQPAKRHYTKMRGYELRSSVNLQGAFNQKGVKANECKTRATCVEELCRKNVRSMK